MAIRERQSLSEITAQIEGLSDNMEQLADLPDSAFQQFAREAFEGIEPIAKDMLMQNFERSNVGTLSDPMKYQGTGKLRSAVQNAEVRLRFRGKEVAIIAFMQPGIAPYEMGKEKKSRSDFYTVAASLNFGAVRVAKEKRQVVDLAKGTVKEEVRDVVGERAKRTIKKVALNQSVSERAVNAVEEGRSFNRFQKAVSKNGNKTDINKTIKGFHIGTAEEKASSVSMSGGAVVIKPRPFFEFTDQQKQMISQSFMRMFMQIYFRSFGIEA